MNFTLAVIFGATLCGIMRYRILQFARGDPRHCVVYTLIYLIIALVLALTGAGVLGWQLYRASRALQRSERQVQSLQQDRAIRQNLEYILEGRKAEVKKLRARLRKREEDLAALEKQASELNLNLFHESGLRILREKEEGARRMKLELLEKQLDEANEKLRQQREAASADEVRMTGIIAEQQARIDKLNARLDRLVSNQSRRAARRAQEGLPNQMTLTDLLGNVDDMETEDGGRD